MNAAAIHEEVSRQVGSFMEIMKAQPLSLALVMMNVLLVAFLFYSNSQVLTQRQGALDQIVTWQRATDQLMASCVSIEVMKLVVDALERDRTLYRQILPHPPQTMPVPVPVPPAPDGFKLQSDDTTSLPFHMPP